MSRAVRAGAPLALALALLGAAGPGRQAPAPVGYISTDRVVEMATAAVGSVADLQPSPDALASLVALVDPVHLRVFLCASRPADLKIAASVGKAAEAAANPALSVEFIAVAEDLSEPAALVAENGVTETPEIIIYWLGAEIGRMNPAAEDAVAGDLAALILVARTQIAEEMILDNDFFREVFHSDLVALDCKRCHGPRARPSP